MHLLSVSLKRLGRLVRQMVRSRECSSIDLSSAVLGCLWMCLSSRWKLPGAMLGYVGTCSPNLPRNLSRLLHPLLGGCVRMCSGVGRRRPSMNCVVLMPVVTTYLLTSPRVLPCLQVFTDSILLPGVSWNAHLADLNLTVLCPVCRCVSVRQRWRKVLSCGTSADLIVVWVLVLFLLTVR